MIRGRCGDRRDKLLEFIRDLLEHSLVLDCMVSQPARPPLPPHRPAPVASSPEFIMSLRESPSRHYDVDWNRLSPAYVPTFGTADSTIAHVVGSSRPDCKSLPSLRVHIVGWLTCLCSSQPKKASPFSA